MLSFHTIVQLTLALSSLAHGATLPLNARTLNTCNKPVNRDPSRYTPPVYYPPRTTPGNIHLYYRTRSTGESHADMPLTSITSACDATTAALNTIISTRGADFRFKYVTAAGYSDQEHGLFVSNGIVIRFNLGVFGLTASLEEAVDTVRLIREAATDPGLMYVEEAQIAMSVGEEEFVWANVDFRLDDQGACMTVA